MKFNYISVEIVPNVNYQKELKELKSKRISTYSGSFKTKLIYVNLANSNEVLVYDLTRCSKNYYYNYIRVLRTCLN